MSKHAILIRAYKWFEYRTTDATLGWETKYDSESLLQDLIKDQTCAMLARNWILNFS